MNTSVISKNGGLNLKAVSAVRRVLWSIVRFLILFGLSFIILYPILYMISVGIRMPEEIMDPAVIWIPKTFTASNIEFVLERSGYTEAFMRTAMLAVLCTVFQTFTCAVTGYGFARFKFKGRTVLFLAALLTFIVPPQIISMPLYIEYSAITRATGIPLINTVLPSSLAALFGQGLRAGIFIYLFRQYYKNLPIELEDAAYLDGCGPLKAFFSIMLKNSAPMLLVTFVLTFVWYWNDYINVALFFGQSRPLAVLLASLQDIILTMRDEAHRGYTNLQTNAFVNTFCIMFILPPVVFYTILQKKFTESLVSSGIVG